MWQSILNNPSPIIANLLSASISACVLFIIAAHYTTRFKRIDSTLEFSKRFQELLKDQRLLNAAYDRDRLASPALPQTCIEKEDAIAWWWRFFDLLLYEFDFFHQKLVREDRFVE